MTDQMDATTPETPVVQEGVTPETETKTAIEDDKGSQSVNEEPKTNSDAELWQQRFHKLSEGERLHRKRLEDLKTQEEQFNAKMREFEETKGKFDSFMELQKAKEQDPIKIFETFDMSWDDVVNSQLKRNQEDNQPPEMKEINKRLKQLEEHNNSLQKTVEEREAEHRKQLEQSKLEQEKKQAQEYGDNLATFAHTNKEKYPFLSKFDTKEISDSLLQVAVNSFNNTGKALTENEICDALENEYKAFFSKFQSPDVTQKSDDKPKDEAPMSKTLSANNTSSATEVEKDLYENLPKRPLTPHERRNFALYGNIEGPKE